MEEYFTIKKASAAEFVERKSRFISYVSPVTTEEDALNFIEKVKKEHHDATHNVPVYIIKTSGIKRYSDDGEPQGTAGIPMLDVLEKRGLTDIVLVATRYFGGTLLGAGGLVRAYTKSAVSAIDSAEIICMKKASVLEMRMEYSLYDQVMNMLESRVHTLIDTQFLAEITVILMIPNEDLESFLKEIRSLSASRIKPTVLEEKFGEFEV